jgi:hypothetical protein
MNVFRESAATCWSKSQANKPNTKRVALPQEIESNILGGMAVLRCNMHTADSMTRMVTERGQGQGPSLMPSTLGTTEVRFKSLCCQEINRLSSPLSKSKYPPIRPLPL